MTTPCLCLAGSTLKAHSVFFKSWIGSKLGFRMSWARHDPGVGHILPGPVEIMDPIYSRDLWTCLFEFIKEDEPRGWGLQAASACHCGSDWWTSTHTEVPRSFSFLHFAVRHLDTKASAAAMRNEFSQDRAMESLLAIKGELIKRGHKDCVQKENTRDNPTPLCMSVGDSLPQK